MGKKDAKKAKQLKQPGLLGFPGHPPQMPPNGSYGTGGKPWGAGSNLPAGDFHPIDNSNMYPTFDNREGRGSFTGSAGGFNIPYGLPTGQENLEYAPAYPPQSDAIIPPVPQLNQGQTGASQGFYSPPT